MSAKSYIYRTFAHYSHTAKNIISSEKKNWSTRFFFSCEEVRAWALATRGVEHIHTRLAVFIVFVILVLCREGGVCATE